MGFGPQVNPCGLTLRIKDVRWQDCRSTAYVEIRPCRCSCSYLLPTNKCSWHSHSHWWESPSCHLVCTNLFDLQIYTTSRPFRTRFTLSLNTYTLLQLLLRLLRTTTSTTFQLAIWGASTYFQSRNHFFSLTFSTYSQLLQFLSNPGVGVTGSGML